MKAIQVAKPGDADCLALVDIEKPTVQAGTVLVKNKYAGVNYIDTYIRSGLYPVSMPTLLGREGSGVIEQVGQGVTGFNVGDRVAFLTVNNSYAEYSVVSTSKLIKLPDDVPFDVGAACLLQGLTALTLVTRSYKVKKGDIVLVHAAAGGTGRILVQLCKHYGATVIGTTSTEEKAEIARQSGADHIILYSKESVPDRVREITGGKMVNVVFDGVGKSTFNGSFDSLARCGYLVSFGNASGKVPPIEINILSRGNIVLQRPMLNDYIATQEEFDDAANTLMSLISEKKVEINICKVFDLANAVDAHKYIEARLSTGKVLIKI
ncbi:hypothetical protein BB560_007268 [Smittium megazygosporum]|uniref:Probable quinone oxidoreductase n=1 Tax=Smittium megazygosporum TaxID=133381 RepID=A0A2T9XXF8_9FUNG|nr:hypothetical protein BB560_007268 [Smittium megazygosporum]